MRPQSKGNYAAAMSCLPIKRVSENASERRSATNSPLGDLGVFEFCSKIVLQDLEDEHPLAPGRGKYMLRKFLQAVWFL